MQYIKIKTALVSLSILMVTAIVLVSCEKVVDLELKGAEKKYVIEAVVADMPGFSEVLISQTKDFDQDNNFPGVSGAVVTVTEVGGLTTVFNETSPGVYQSGGYVGEPGKTYQLSVTINGQTFTATSSMLQKVNLDSVFVTDEFLFSENRKIVNVQYDDPAGMGNNYRFIQYVNGNKESQLQIQNDDYIDGNTVTNRLFFFADEEDDGFINSGDEVSVEMQCIDASMYKYWYSLFRSALGTSGQATPANPVSNMQGGALGYFSAHTRQRVTITVP